MTPAKYKGARTVKAAMGRLNEVAELYTTKTADGCTLLGHPRPIDISLELRRVYETGYRAGLKNGKYKK